MAIKTVDIGNGNVKTYSTIHHKIERDGVLYDEAVDPADSGRVYTETDVPVDGWVPMKYSVVSIIEAMRELGKYEEFRAMLEAVRLDWDFVGANYMSETHPSFMRMCEALTDPENGIITEKQLDETLPRCVWRAE